MSLARFSVRRPVTTVMIYVAVLLLGVIAWTRLPRELFPQIAYPELAVVTHYKDAAPEEIEVLVTKPIEEVTGTVAGLRRISSISKEEISVVIAEFNWGTNMDFAALGIREKLDLIKERLPRGAEDPVVMKHNPFDEPVMVLSLSGALHPQELLALARKQVKNELEKVEGVAAVNLSGGLEREILVEVDQGRLQAARLPISRVADSLAKANLNYPAGTIKEAFYEYLIRTLGEFSLVKEMPAIPVSVDEKEEDTQAQMEKAQKAGPLERETGIPPTQRLILLKEIATVKDTYREPESFSRMNGKDNVSLKIQKQADANTLQLAKRVKQAIEEIRPALPPGVEITVASDQSLVIESSIRGVMNAAVQGGLLAFVVLYLFLGNFWAAANVSFAIPISILATFALMFFTGTTVNIISLGGLALGVGMLVDAGIVVVENIARYREQGKTAVEAAIEGTEEMAGAVGGSVLTTIVVFLPMVFVIGIAGQLFRDLAYTVTFSLLASWAVSLTLTPVFASRIRGGSSGRSFMEPLVEGMARWDEGMVSWFLRYRWVGILGVILLFAVSVMALKEMNREVLPRVDQGQFTLRVNLQPGTRLSVTDRVARRVEEVLQATPEVRDVAVTIGSSKEKQRAEELVETLGSHQAQILVNLWPRYRGWGRVPSSGVRARRTSAVVQELKTTLAREPLEKAEMEYLVQESVFKSSALSSMPVVVEVKGTDLKRLEGLALGVKKELEGIEGLYGAQTSLVQPSPEIKVRVMKDRAATYHLSVSDIALTAQTAVKGFVATKFKEEGKEIDIRVRLRKEDRQDMNKIRRLLIHSPLDLDIPLSEVAYLPRGTGPTEIRRLDQQRTVLVSAQLHGRPIGQALEEVNFALGGLKVPPGYTVELTGENKEMRESFRSLAFALLLSILLVYMVMASEFESLWQPFLIMATIPMSLIGVAAGLWITGTPISVIAVLGFIILGGIVVDNGIVLVDYVNLLRGQGLALEEAVLQASRTRLRPILMTAGTTVLGLLPLALGLDEGVDLQMPMAITVMGGMTVSTFLTLIFLPTLYMMGARFFEGAREALFGAAPALAPAPAPALALAGAPGMPVIESGLSSPRKRGSHSEQTPSSTRSRIPASAGMTDKIEIASAPEPPLPEEPPPPELEEPPTPELIEPEIMGQPRHSKRQEGPDEESSVKNPDPSARASGPQDDGGLESMGSSGQAPEQGTEPAASPEFPEIPEGYGGEEVAPERTELPIFLPPEMLQKPEADAVEPRHSERQERTGEESSVKNPVLKTDPSTASQPQDDTEKRLNSRQKKLLATLEKHREITRHDYAKLVRASVPTAARDLKQLVDQGLIKGVGPLGPGRVYVLA